MVLFNVSLFISLVIFTLGMIFKISTWFRTNPGIGINEINTSHRLFAATKGILSTILSPKILTLLKVFILDVLFQRRILKESLLRWLMHMCIYFGFVSLLVIHALGNLITAALFSDYSSTLNPFLFLRNFFGLMIFVGLAISVYRRHFSKTPRLMSNAMDYYAVIILAVIMTSGILLEGVKITSYNNYKTMVEDYADFDDEESLDALESYWIEKFGVVSPNLEGPFDSSILAKGKELHEMNCSACHSRPQWAFMSFGVAKTIKPVAVELDSDHIQTLFWYVHFMACFIGLAYLPFSRMFHIFASPLSLLINSVMDKKSDPANIATRQAIELDACTHCGTCSLRCLMGVTYEMIPNMNILPSEKLTSIKRFFSGKRLAKEDIQSIQEGLYLCTSCYRCTLVCPAGINLQDLWFNVKETFLQNGYPELFVLSPLSYYRGLKRDIFNNGLYQKPLQEARAAVADLCRLFDAQDAPLDIKDKDRKFIDNLVLSTQGNTFSYCFTCTTCTSACPVVWNYSNPRDVLGLVPHQIIRAAVLGLSDLIFRSRMLWSCLGCYRCQDVCPQGVCVTDVLYELRNMAVRRVKGVSQSISSGGHP
jgi:heterodisulfide reductase subunit C/nitrate reductase gamma subunit